jgi:hypothetical protein
MIASDLVMKVPPHPLDRVAVRAVLRQQVQLDAVPVLPQVTCPRILVQEL